MSGETYYRVGPRFWMDSASWSDDAKLLALYILTCSHRRAEGIFRLPVPYMLADLGWTRERFRKPFGQLLSEGFIDYDEEPGVILIQRALKWQAPENPNQVKSAVRSIAELPANRLLEPFIALAERYSERLAKGLRERFPEGFAKPPTTTTTPTPTTEGANAPVERVALDEQAKSASADVVRELFAYWQERCGHPNALPSDNRKRKVKARLREGYTPEQIRCGIDGAAKAAYTSDDGRRHDDLELICRNASKLDSFIERGVKATERDDPGWLDKLNATRQAA